MYGALRYPRFMRLNGKGNEQAIVLGVMHILFQHEASGSR
jgi:hypothetical protein